MLNAYIESHNSEQNLLNVFLLVQGYKHKINNKINKCK